MKTFWYSGLILIALLLSPAPGPAQSVADGVVRVGLVHSPPYAIRGDDGNWSGMSVELWRSLAEQTQLRYELVPTERSSELVGALDAGEIDVALTTDLAAPDMDSVTFLQHHYLSTLGVARPATNKLTNVVQAFFNKQLWIIVGGLSLLLLVVGTLIYFVERGGNEDQFGGDRTLAEGIGSGFWWAGVTMTTIGYGDKAPATLGGRIVAMLWMLVAMAVSASLTASIISAVNQKASINFPDDLRDKRVTVVERSPAAEYLEERGYRVSTAPTVATALQIMEDDHTDLVVADANALRYTIDNKSGLNMSVTGTNDAPVAYALAVREGTDLADRLDQSLVRFILSPTWRGIVREYGGGR